MAKYYTCLTYSILSPAKPWHCSTMKIWLFVFTDSRCIGKLNERRGDSASLFRGKTVHTKLNSRLMKLCFVDYKSTRRTGKIWWRYDIFELIQNFVSSCLNWTERWIPNNFTYLQKSLFHPHEFSTKEEKETESQHACFVRKQRRWAGNVRSGKQQVIRSCVMRIYTCSMEHCQQQFCHLSTTKGREEEQNGAC